MGKSALVLNTFKTLSSDAMNKGNAFYLHICDLYGLKLEDVRGPRRPENIKNRKRSKNSRCQSEVLLPEESDQIHVRCDTALSYCIVLFCI